MIIVLVLISVIIGVFYLNVKLYRAYKIHSKFKVNNFSESDDG